MRVELKNNDCGITREHDSVVVKVKSRLDRRMYSCSQNTINE